jgi:hypothetical protein
VGAQRAIIARSGAGYASWITFAMCGKKAMLGNRAENIFGLKGLEPAIRGIG